LPKDDDRNSEKFKRKVEISQPPGIPDLPQPHLKEGSLAFYRSGEGEVGNHGHDDFKARDKNVTRRAGVPGTEKNDEKKLTSI